MSLTRKSEGFEGQRAIVLPKKIREICAYSPATNSLYVTDIGFYPKAMFHYRERKDGIAQNILIYCAEGVGWVDLPDQSIRINPFEYLIIPANMPHKYGADPKTPWSIYWIHFKGLQSDNFTNLLSANGSSFVKYCGLSEERNQLFGKMYAAFEKGYDIDNLIMNSLTTPYFLSTFIYPDRFIRSLSKKERPYETVVDRAIQFMQKHLHQSLSLKDFTQEVNLSVSHFANIFKKKTGHSPIEYFNHLKMQRACQFLQFTDLRINEIAQKVGISDPYYFSRIFTKMMGMTPSEYRNRKH